MAAGLITNEELTKKDTVDFGRDFTEYPMLHKTICKQNLRFDLDMSRRRCTIIADNMTESPIIFDNLPEKVWLACSMKSECTCIIEI